MAPHTKLFRSKPHYSLFLVFGCMTFPHLRTYNSHKFEFHSIHCVLHTDHIFVARYLCYSNDHLEYLCFDENTGHIFVARYCKFLEDICYFSRKNTNPDAKEQIDEIWLSSFMHISNHLMPAQETQEFTPMCNQIRMKWQTSNQQWK